MKVLIVEDDPDSRDLLKVLLELDGHDVTAAWNGMEGWQAFQSGEFPVVLSDWLMPEMDGLELCRRIRASDRPSYSYVILVTALHGKSSYLQGMNAGADDFVSKPFEGILPTCMYCKKIRDEQNQWVGIESYISKRSRASFSHGVCPVCYEKVVQPELDRIRPT